MFFILSHLIYYQITIVADYEKYYDTLVKTRNDEDKVEDINFLNNTKIDIDYQNMEDLLLLENYITNPFINFMYRIDIELFVLLIQE